MRTSIRVIAAIAAPALAALAHAQSAVTPPANCSGGFVIIPDSVNSRLSLFSAIDGSPVNLNFVNDQVRLVSPREAVCSGENTIYVSDSGAGAIYEYDQFGAWIRTITDSSLSGMADFTGISVYDNQLYVACNGGANDGTIQRFERDGSGQTTWATTNLEHPHSMLFRAGDVLITERDANSVEQFDFTGVHTAFFSGIQQPQQIQPGIGGNLLVAGGGTAPGIHEISDSGAAVDFFSTDSPLLGVFQLGNGNILFTDGEAVRIINPISEEIDTVVAGGYGYINFLPVPAPGAASLLALAGLAALRRRRGA